MPTVKIGRRTLASLPAVSKPTVFYDSDLSGFGLKVFPSGIQSWIVEYRPGAGGRSVHKRRMVIGSPAILTPDEARKRATGLLARVELGEDPARNRTADRRSLTLGELLSKYMDERIRAKKKPSTAKLFDGFIANHIPSTLANRKANSVSQDDVAKLHVSIGKEYVVTANRVVGLLSSAYAYGIKTRVLADGSRNPAAGIEKYQEESRERYLSETEFLRLGDAIREAETTGIAWAVQDRSNPKAKHAPKKPESRRTNIGPHAAAALRLLLFTGARLREILNLKWEQVDLQRGLLFLPDSKTGKKTIVLGGPALAVLRNLTRIGEYVIAGNDPNKPRADLQRPWELVSKRADLEGVRLHDLRHSFASVAAGSGLGLPIIGKLLGHTNASTTERYAHLASDPLRRASDAISGAIAAAMGEGRL